MISTYRMEIDRIDKEIMALFKARLACVEQIGKYKSTHQIPVTDPKREQEIRCRLNDQLSGEIHQGALMELMEEMMAISRGVQRSLGAMDHGVAGFQGTEGAYSEEATLGYFGDAYPRQALGTFEDVFAGVASGQITYGVVPIENTSTGGIFEVYDLLLKYGLSIVGEQTIRVQHHLIGLPGTSMDEVTEVHSHPQGIAQCSRFLSYYPEWRKISQLNTASSVRQIRETKSGHMAAIGSRRAADIYGMEILKEGIQDNLVNKTRFIVLGRESQQDAKADKISMVVQTSHTAGALFEVLAVIAEQGINMLKIESRPDKQHPGQYVFYVDIEGHLGDANVKRALEKIGTRQKFFRMLGNYRQSK